MWGVSRVHSRVDVVASLSRMGVYERGASVEVHTLPLTVLFPIKITQELVFL